MTTIARTEYMERTKLASDLSFENDKGVTKQSDLKDTDINSIFRRFEKTGILPELIKQNGRYGDYSNVPDYQEALNIVAHANEQFSNLDVLVRNRFDNDPAKFLAFATDEKNYAELNKMGLLKPEVSEAFNKAELEKAKADRKIAEETEAKNKAAQ